MSIILFILILGILIFVHELGHFSVAKKSGIRVDEFAVGFPPKIFSWVRGGTKYALNLIPFGGYVKIFGENPDDESMSKDAKDSFVNKSKLTQVLVLVAGVLFNVIFAWLMFSIAIFSGFDVPVETLSFTDDSQAKIQILGVEEETPAFRSGLEEGTEIFGLQKGDEAFVFNKSEDALEVIRNNEAPFILKTSEGDVDIQSKLERDGEELVGIYLGDVVSTVERNPFKAIYNGFFMTGYSVKEISIALYDLILDAFQGQAELDNIAGPVGIVGLVDDAAESGIVSVILFTAFISINLAILNLLPFPALDGGRLLFILIEVVTRKKMNHKVANILNLVGFLILILLMIIITISDIGKLF